MVNGLYTASRGMSNILAKQDVHSQNLANTSTNGFKMAKLVNTADVSIGRNEDGELKQKEMQKTSEVFTSFSQGPMVRTGNTFDLGLSSPGFFSVETENGIGYTRNGSFSLNSYGELVTLSGKRVLDDSGSAINVKGGSVQFMDDGGVTVDGKKTATLGIYDFADTKKLQYGAEGLFNNLDEVNNPPVAPKTIGVKGGFLEGSNSDPVSIMVNMLADFRNYEADQKVMQSIDQTLRQAVTDVGRV